MLCTYSKIWLNAAVHNYLMGHLYKLYIVFSCILYNLIVLVPESILWNNKCL